MRSLAAGLTLALTCAGLCSGAAIGRHADEPRHPPSALDLVRQPPSILDSIGQRALAAGDPVLAFAAYRAMQMRAGTSARERHTAPLGLRRDQPLLLH